jgi:hypothetical protein
MFSGNLPFHNIRNEFQLMRVVKRGGRPPRPTHDLCHSRGLTDGMWKLMEDCWAHHSQNRPSAAQVVPRIHALCHPLVDDRPCDTFPLLLSPQLMRSKCEHPLAALWDMVGGIPSRSMSDMYSQQAESPAAVSCRDHDYRAGARDRDPEWSLDERDPKRRRTERMEKDRPGR